MSEFSQTRIVVITGATRGLGRAMVSGIIAGGHTVYGCGRNADAVAELRRTYGRPHDFQVVEVSDGIMVQQWADAVLANPGVPDLLINNAAISPPLAPLWEVTEANFAHAIDVNIKGVANTIRSFVPAMIKAGRGVVVNFSSGWGRSTDPDVATYCCTKYAVEGLTQALSKELPPGLAAVALNPGIINTDMLRQCIGESASRYPAPEEWARRAVPYILRLGASHNGKMALSVPGAKLEV